VGMPATAGVTFGGDQHMLAESGETMTTQRTTIGRRLAVGRRTHRPPWGAWKAGHRSIVAPVMATVAASMALGVGIAVARVARERRSKRDRRLGLLPGEQLGSALQRMALGQLDLALETIGSGGEPPGERAVHETRKALKRLRALLRLLRSNLGEETYARESRALRDAGRSLAGARDAEVMLRTLDSLIERHPGKLKGRGGVIALRSALLAERDQARRRTLSDPGVLARAVAELRACRVRLSGWELPQSSGLQLVEGDLLRLYRQGAKRRRAAARAKEGDVLEMHRWRKRVKDLRYVAEMLQPAEGATQGMSPKPGSKGKAKGEHRREEQARKAVKSMRKVARRADRLGEMLGEDHDLAVLAKRIAQGGGSPGEGRAKGAKPIKGASRKTLLKLIARRRHKLRRAALREGERLYGDSPRKFLRRAAVLDQALAALLNRHRAVEIDAAYTAYDAHPIEEPDAWGDLASFREAAAAS
jgi:CHAD domain